MSICAMRVFAVLVRLYLSAAMLLAGLLAHAADSARIAAFSTAAAGAALPAGWQPLVFSGIERHTSYELVRDQDSVVIRASANGSASGLTHKLHVEGAQFPLLRWRWKIDRVVEKADIRSKRGDDYAARVYVTFLHDLPRLSAVDRFRYRAVKLLYGEYPPHAGITYVWDNRTPVGTVAPSPYTARAKMMVLQSGNGRAGEWVTEERNVYEDYKRIFGEEPPPISGVAIMTDTDGTDESVIAHYGDLTLIKSP